MANEQHLKWLAEGVEAWNKRRKQEPFFPDLEAVKLGGVDLSGFDLKSANFQRADLENANLIDADLRLANFTRASLRFTELKGAKVHDTVFFDTDVRTEAHLNKREETVSLKNIYRVSLKGSIGLEQKQISGMQGTKGEFGTILPDQFSAPGHWDESPLIFYRQSTRNVLPSEIGDIRIDSVSKLHIFPEADEVNEVLPLNKSVRPDGSEIQNTATQSQNEHKTYIAQASFILTTANASKNNASMAVVQLDALVQNYIAQNGRPNNSPEIDFLEALKTTFINFETVLDKNTSDAARKQELEALLEASQEEVANLTKLLSDKPSTFHSILVGAAGGALGTAIVAATAAIYGIAAPDLINAINDLLTVPSEPTQPLEITEV